MIDVLAFVVEHFWAGEPDPDLGHLGRRLSAAGFDAADIDNALGWLDALNRAGDQLEDAESLNAALAAGSLRLYAPAEQRHLPPECQGFLRFLTGSGLLSPVLHELVLERMMAMPSADVSLDAVRLTAMLVHWRFGGEADVLALESLCQQVDPSTLH